MVGTAKADTHQAAGVFHMLMAIALEPGVVKAAEQQRFTRKNGALRGDRVAQDRVDRGALAGQEHIVHPGCGEIGVAPKPSGGDPLGLPAWLGRLGVVLQQNDRVASQHFGQEIKGAVLVPGDAHVDTADNRHVVVPQPWECSIRRAVIRDHQIDRRMPCETAHLVDGGGQHLAPVVGDDAYPDPRRVRFPHAMNDASSIAAAPAASM